LSSVAEPPGLSACLVLGQARRRTLLVDAGQQSNLAAHGIGGLLGHDGRPPNDKFALSCGLRVHLCLAPGQRRDNLEEIDGGRRVKILVGPQICHDVEFK